MNAHVPAHGRVTELQPYDVVIRATSPDGRMTARVDAESPYAVIDEIQAVLARAGFAPGSFEIESALRAEGERSYYEIAMTDIGRATIHAFGRTWPVADFLGRILATDVGKRVYLFIRPGESAAQGSYLQAENDAQRNARVAQDVRAWEPE